MNRHSSLTEAENYVDLAKRGLWPMNVQSLDGYPSQFHSAVDWRGDLMDCNPKMAGIMHWIDTAGTVHTVEYDCLEIGGHQVTYYKFRSEEHRRVWKSQSNLPYTQWLFGRDACYECVFRCTLVNDSAFYSLWDSI